MSKTIQKIQQFINHQNLFTPDQKLIVGVSGGADSVFLIHVLHELGYSCMIAHCNFHLRGEESDRDALFVKSLAEKLNLPFRSIDFQTEEYASKQKISIEMAARELRYHWFAELKEKEEADCIVIAHHSDDVVETFLINMTRGTGIHGLTGIKPKKGDIVRPLLALSREEIVACLQQKNIPFVEDSTNKETIYTRNKFRNHIIPLLQTINPSFKESVLQTIGYLQQAESFMEDRLNAIKEDLFVEKENSCCISIEKLKKENSPIFILYELLHPYGFPASVINDIYNGLDGTSGKQYMSEKYRILKDRKWLILSDRHQEAPVTYSIKDTDTTIENPLKMTITYKENKPGCTIIKDKRFCYLDVNKLVFPLEIRRWREGDTFVPFGMKNRKKVSDFFIDRQFSILQKEQTWLLLSGGEIAWIMGERSDDRFKIDSKTKKIMILEINK